MQPSDLNHGDRVRVEWVPGVMYEGDVVDTKKDKKRREDEIAGLKEALTILESESPAAFLAIRTARPCSRDAFFFTQWCSALPQLAPRKRRN